MRRVIYGGAMSLDGYIAAPDGSYDWITHDPEIDFVEMMSRYDTFLMGRKTFEVMQKMQYENPNPSGARNIVFSRTMNPAEHPGVEIHSDAGPVVRELRAKPGKDIALFGGGELFASLLPLGLVDAVDVAIIPVLLGQGIPFLAPPATRATLQLKKHRLYAKSGILRMEYDIIHA